MLYLARRSGSPRPVSRWRIVLAAVPCLLLAAALVAGVVHAAGQKAEPVKHAAGR